MGREGARERGGDGGGANTMIPRGWMQVIIVDKSTVVKGMNRIDASKCG